jgi:hypothetical protein
LAWYTSPDNPVNRPTLAPQWSTQVRQGQAALQLIGETLVDDVSSLARPCVFALDGFNGTNFAPALERIQQTLDAAGVEIMTIDISDAYKSPPELDALFQPYLDRDPAFGFVYPGELEDMIGQGKASQVAARLEEQREANGKRLVVICYGPGAALPCWRHLLDRIAYLDITREQLIIRSERGEVRALGVRSGTLAWWKRSYYVEYPLLNRHKKWLLSNVDWYVENTQADEPVLLPAEAYHSLMTALSGMLLVFKVFYMPGTFGGTEFGQRFNVKGLPNTSWNYQISVGDSHLMIDAGDSRVLEIPFYNLLYAHPLRLLGEYSSNVYPDHFPLAVYMQDGYFPPDSDADFKRTHMPQHLHPDTAYCREHFGEPLGRYETYYIVRADPGAVTMHGFRDDADIDAYVREVVRSAETREEFDWRPYIYEHPSTTGELHQLPPGTVHGTGGRQIILEIDTNPSRESTEYSFYLYDYCRPNYNYRTNDMTGSPAKLHLEHGLAALRRNRKQDVAGALLRAAPVPIRVGEDWREVSFPMYPNMPYQVNRLEFSRCIEDRTDDFFHCLALTRGTQVRVHSKHDPSNGFTLHYCTTVVIPACFGEYVCENLGHDDCEIIKAFLIPGPREVPTDVDW